MEANDKANTMQAGGPWSELGDGGLDFNAQERRREQLPGIQTQAFTDVRELQHQGTGLTVRRNKALTAAHEGLASIGMGAALLLGRLAAAGSGDCEALVITNQPLSQYVLEGCPVTFTVGVVGTGPFLYQWEREGQPISDGTNANYTIPVVWFSDNGVILHVTIANACSQATSAEAVLVVSQDVVPPRLLRARGDATLERILVSFSVRGCGSLGLDPASAQASAHYAVSSGVSVANAVLDATGTNVVLTTSPLTAGEVSTLTVNEVTDRAGNGVLRGSQTQFQAWVLLAGSEPPMIVPPPVSRSGTTNFIAWPPGSRLQRADSITGPWATLPDAIAPYPASETKVACFFRALFSP